MALSVTILGTGTSQGIPVIGCQCGVCQSDDSRDKRLRVSVLLQKEGSNIVIDCGPDFRQQMLQSDTTQLDAVVFTHEHNDHIAGLDDIRPFNFMTWKDMPLYAMPRVANAIKKRFPYAFAVEKYPGAPMLVLHELATANAFTVGSMDFIPIRLMHGQLPILGFRVDNFAYLTDMKTIDDAELTKLKNLDCLIINALHQEEHHSHMNLEQALAFAAKVGAQQTYLTHLSHQMGKHELVLKTLPKGVSIAFDGMQLEL